MVAPVPGRSTPSWRERPAHGPVEAVHGEPQTVDVPGAAPQARARVAVRPGASRAARRRRRRAPAGRPAAPTSARCPARRRGGRPTRRRAGSRGPPGARTTPAGSRAATGAIGAGHVDRAGRARSRRRAGGRRRCRRRGPGAGGREGCPSSRARAPGRPPTASRAAAPGADRGTRVRGVCRAAGRRPRSRRSARGRWAQPPGESVHAEPSQCRASRSGASTRAWSAKARSASGLAPTVRRSRTTRAGLPTTTAHSGTSRVTTEPAPTTACDPMRTPSSTTTCEPIQTSSPTVIPSEDIGCRKIGSVRSAMPWSNPSRLVWLPIRTASPSRTVPRTTVLTFTVQSAPMTRSPDRWAWAATVERSPSVSESGWTAASRDTTQSCPTVWPRARSSSWYAAWSARAAGDASSRRTTRVRSPRAARSRARSCTVSLVGTPESFHEPGHVGSRPCSVPTSTRGSAARAPGWGARTTSRSPTRSGTAPDLLGDRADLEWLPPVAGRESGFRNKAKMVVGGTVDAPDARHPRPGRPGRRPARLRALPAGARGRASRARRVRDPRRASRRTTSRRARGELKYVLVTQSPAGELMVRFVLRSHGAGRPDPQAPAVAAGRAAAAAGGVGQPPARRTRPCSRATGRSC